MSITAAAIAGGAALGSTALNWLSANSAAQKQVNWERERAKNAHQWEIQDLEKAGLNPILSAGGSGANTGGINPPVADNSGLNSAAATIAQSMKHDQDYSIAKQQIENDNARVLNETRATNSDLSVKAEQIRLSMEQRANLLAERGLITQKQKTEIINRAKLQSDIELARSEEFLNEQIRGQKAQEMERTKQEIELLKKELEMAPTRKKAAEIENDLREKENKVYYIKETITELTRLGGMGLSIYGTYKAGQAISAYKAERAADRNRMNITDLYNTNGKRISQKVQYYK